LPYKLVIANLLTQGFLRVYRCSLISVISSMFHIHNNLYAAVTRKAKPGNLKKTLVLRESEING